MPVADVLNGRVEVPRIARAEDETLLLYCLRITQCYIQERRSGIPRHCLALCDMRDDGDRAGEARPDDEGRGGPRGHGKLRRGPDHPDHGNRRTGFHADRHREGDTRRRCAVRGGHRIRTGDVDDLRGERRCGLRRPVLDGRGTVRTGGVQPAAGREQGGQDRGRGDGTARRRTAGRRTAGRRTAGRRTAGRRTADRSGRRRRRRGPCGTGGPGTSWARVPSPGSTGPMPLTAAARAPMTCHGTGPASVPRAEGPCALPPHRTHGTTPGRGAPRGKDTAGTRPAGWEARARPGPGRGTLRTQPAAGGCWAPSSGRTSRSMQVRRALHTRRPSSSLMAIS